MIVNKKALVWGSVIALLGVTAIWLKKQIKKIQNFKLTFKKLQVNKFDIKTLDFNVMYDYTNNSDIDINLSSQEYDLYINGVYLNTMTNFAENVLKANSVSPLGFNAKFDLLELDKKLQVSYFKMVTAPKDVKLKIVMRWKVRVGFLKIPVKYTWETDLKEILGWYLPMYKK
jgi:LEA14-like dessication related protein